MKLVFILALQALAGTNLWYGISGLFSLWESGRRDLVVGYVVGFPAAYISLYFLAEHIPLLKRSDLFGGLIVAFFFLGSGFVVNIHADKCRRNCAEPLMETNPVELRPSESVIEARGIVAQTSAQQQSNLFFLTLAAVAPMVLSVGYCVLFLTDGTTHDRAQDAQRQLELTNPGDSSNQVSLGLSYATGSGVPKDDREAARWFLKAAEQGNAAAQCNLGLAYCNGDGVPQDYKESVKWYLKAAHQGDAEAQFRLGFFFDRGSGVIQDYKEAHAWFNLANANGKAEAAQRRDEIAAKMTPAQIEAAQTLARERFAEIEKLKAEREKKMVSGGSL